MSEDIIVKICDRINAYYVKYKSCAGNKEKATIGCKRDFISPTSNIVLNRIKYFLNVHFIKPDIIILIKNISDCVNDYSCLRLLKLDGYPIINLAIYFEEFEIANIILDKIIEKGDLTALSETDPNGYDILNLCLLLLVRKIKRWNADKLDDYLSIIFKIIKYLFSILENPQPVLLIIDKISLKTLSSNDKIPNYFNKILTRGPKNDKYEFFLSLSMLLALRYYMLPEDKDVLNNFLQHHVIFKITADHNRFNLAFEISLIVPTEKCDLHETRKRLDLIYGESL